MQTRLSASCVGRLAARSLASARSGTVGEILSVFPASFYVKTADSDLVFVTNRQLRSPVTLNLDSKTNLQQIIKPHESVSILENGIRIGESVQIDLRSAAQCDEQQRPRIDQYALAKETLYHSSMILMIIGNQLSVLDPASLAHGGAAKFVSNGVLAFRSSDDVNALCRAAHGIVGLGMGFTPSGDDLLAGFFATYNSFAHVVSHKTINLGFDALLRRTGWISAKLLDYMQRQVLDDQVATLIDSAATHDSDAFVLALETLLPRGHISGIDILVGVLLALAIIHDLSEDTEITRIVANRLGLLY